TRCGNKVHQRMTPIRRTYAAETSSAVSSINTNSRRGQHRSASRHPHADRQHQSGARALVTASGFLYPTGDQPPPSYLNDTFTLARYPETLPFSIVTSSSETSATRRSRNDCRSEE